MNYELLKLSKILPTINGRRTLDIYQERLDMARAAQQAQLEEQEGNVPQSKHTFKPHQYLRANPENIERPQKQQKLYEVKSAGKLPAANKIPDVTGGYSNLNVLLADAEPFESLANMVGDGFRKKTVKTTVVTRTTSGPFFKKVQPDASTPMRPGTNSPGAPSNFVFKKKKVLLRDTNELDHIYHYSLGTGFTVIGDDTLGLNGRKVGVKELDQVMFVRQHKKYLKDMKIDPMTTFQSPYRSGDEFPHYDEKMYSSATMASQKGSAQSKVRDMKATQQSREDNNTRVNKVTLDGTYLKSFEKATPRTPNA